MKTVYIKILVGLLSFVSIQANNQNYPVCFICGSESNVVTNPDSVVPVPDGYNTPVNEVDCATLDEAGKDGRISQEECTDLQRSTVLKSSCGCWAEIQGAIQKPSDVPMHITQPSWNKNPAVAAPSETPITTKLPTSSPAFYTKADENSGAPSSIPSNGPSGSPSSVPSNTPSEFPSEIPSSKPSVDTKYISGVDSPGDKSGSVTPSLWDVFALGVIVAMV